MLGNQRRRIGLAAALGAVAASSLCAPASAGNDHLIVAWQRIGPIELGMTAGEVTRIMGEPTQTMPGPFVTIYNWKDELSVTTRTDGSYVTQVCALSPAYATAEGVHPGSTEPAVAALLGQPQSSRVYSRWWKASYTNLFWGGLMISIPLTGFAANHAVRTICVNHSA